MNLGHLRSHRTSSPERLGLCKLVCFTIDGKGVDLPNLRCRPSMAPAFMPDLFRLLSYTQPTPALRVSKHKRLNSTRYEGPIPGVEPSGVSYPSCGNAGTWVPPWSTSAYDGGTRYRPRRARSRRCHSGRLPGFLPRTRNDVWCSPLF